MGIRGNIEKQLGPGYDSSQVLDIGASQDRTAELTPGLYILAPTADCWFKQGGSAVEAAEATDGCHYCAGGALRDFRVDASTGLYVSVFQHDGSTGKASVSELK